MVALSAVDACVDSVAFVAFVAFVAMVAVVALVALSAVDAWVALGTVPNVAASICAPVNDPLATFLAVTAPVASLALVTAFLPSCLEPTAPDLIWRGPTLFLGSVRAANALPPSAKKSASVAVTLAYVKRERKPPSTTHLLVG